MKAKISQILSFQTFILNAIASIFYLKMIGWIK